MTVITQTELTGDTRLTDPSAARQRILAGGIAALRRSRSGRFPLATVLLVLGGLCLPVGFVVIILGWYGTAHTLNSYEQSSYLISGGVLGLGLVIVGGFFYFGYWMTRQLEVTRVALQHAVGAFSRVEAQLSQVAVSSAASAAALNTNGPSSREPRSRRVAGQEAYVSSSRPLVATERGRLLHKPDCAVVAGKTNLRQVDPGSAGYRPCQICDPFEDS